MIDNIIKEKVVAEALKGIDLNALAAELAPAIRKELKEAILHYFSEEYDWNEMLYESEIDTYMTKIVKKIIQDTFKAIK